MAGKVVRWGNDSLYFVLDEVGASSEIDEALSDDDSKSNKLLKNRLISEGPLERVTKPTKALLGHSSKDNNGRCVGTDVDNALGTVVDMDMDIDSESEALNAGKGDKEPLIRLTFRDEDTNKRYRQALMDMLSDTIYPCSIVTSREKDLEIEVWEAPLPIVESDLFSIDSTPNMHAHISNVPSYGKTSGLLSEVGFCEEAKESRRAASSCFNCLGDHTLRDCPKPRNMQEINKNRSNFQMNNKSLKASRYHLDDNQKYGHIAPGVLSGPLRSALNLANDQQPLFLYKMRQLGYPPGWLEEARVSHSGVVLYDTEGSLVLEEDEEEGEIVPHGAKDKFDVKKIIDFPGFNAPLPEGIVDESELYGCPMFSTDQSKEMMLEKFGPNAAIAAYKKKAQPKVMPETAADGEHSKAQRGQSPSIEEMEEQKRELLMALDKESEGRQETESACSQPRDEPPSSPPRVGQFKEVDFGTPILQSVSPYARLPKREHFSVNVSDVINFENLPNSTGKYETMSSLITKIRETVSNSKNE